MAVFSDGTVAGSVSGGCVEAAIYTSAQQVFADGSTQTLTFCPSDDDAFTVGLTCGGTIKVFLQLLTAADRGKITSWIAKLDRGTAFAIATIVHGPEDILGCRLLVDDEDCVGTLPTPMLARHVLADSRALMTTGQTASRHYEANGSRLGAEIEVLIWTSAASPKLIIFGAIDYSAALAKAAKPLGYRVIVCDARPVFATVERCPDADEIVVEWPDRWLARQQLSPNDAICVLTHDSKFDVPAILQALQTPVRYIGAMGSRLTHEDRTRRLQAAGVTPEQLARVRSPIGLDLGASTPAETAISILPEIAAVTRGGSGASLRDSNGRVHREQTELPVPAPVAAQAEFASRA